MGQETVPNPTDRGKLVTKRHIVVNMRGILLVVLVSGANRHDSTMFEKCIDALPAVRGLRGRARRWPSKLHADKGYEFARCRAHLRSHGITSRIARRGIESSTRLGKHRWVVEKNPLLLQVSTSCAFALSEGRTFVRRCSCSPPQSSALASSSGRVSHSYR